MRLTFLLTILPLPFLIVLAACAGDGGGQKESVLIEDVEAIALQIGDMPMDFVEVESSATHVTDSESCAGAEGAELDECLSNLKEWGRTDGYQVEYVSSDPTAFYSGTYDVFSAVSIYQDQEGAIAAFRDGKERLQKELAQLEDSNLVEIPTVGEESVAFVATTSQEMGARDIPVSLNVVDFRRGNVLARIGTTAPTALASVDDALSLAQVMDGRILRVAGLGTPTAASPTTPTAASPTATP